MKSQQHNQPNASYLTLQIRHKYKLKIQYTHTHCLQEVQKEQKLAPSPKYLLPALPARFSTYFSFKLRNKYFHWDKPVKCVFFLWTSLQTNGFFFFLHKTLSTEIKKFQSLFNCCGQADIIDLSRWLIIYVLTSFIRSLEKPQTILFLTGACFKF